MGSTKHRFTVYSITSSIIYVLGQLFDLSTTYVLSPALALETNIMVKNYDFGWSYIIVSALLFSALMFLIQFWMWRRLCDDLPDRRMSYKDFYRSLLFDESEISSVGHVKPKVGSALMGVAFVVAYAAIASKLITCFWNLMLITQSVGTHPPMVVRTVKLFFAAAFGLLMFFVIPYWLQKRR